jgi:hypothetical protein
MAAGWMSAPKTKTPLRAFEELVLVLRLFQFSFTPSGPGNYLCAQDVLVEMLNLFNFILLDVQNLFCDVQQVYSESLLILWKNIYHE